MASDAHAHPFDLISRYSGAEEERRQLSIACAASSWRPDEFLFLENLSSDARTSGGPAMALCFGIHPQLPKEDAGKIDASLVFLEELIRGRRLQALGEIGFDLFDESFRASQQRQVELFELQLNLAIAHQLPVVLHLRKAIDKAFSYSRELSRLPGVIFHSWSGTSREAMDILSRGIPAFFSFGTPILLGHRKALEAVATLPVEHLLFETDAPYQPLLGRLHPEKTREFSSWSDLGPVIAGAAVLRHQDRRELELLTDFNFRRVFRL